ncbi:hypothetical protein ACFW04_014250 [Cataglyphis niger]
MCDELRKKSKQSFSEAWLSDDRIKSWIRKVSSDNSFYHCIICNKNISCNTHVLRHANSACPQLFSTNRKRSYVLKSMNMGRTKCKNIISNVLYPVETNRVVNRIQNTKFSIFIDETSDISNEKWMTFLVWFVDSEILDVRTQLIKLINIDAKNSSSGKLFNAFKCEIWKLNIPFRNIVALSCNKTSVMTGKHLSFKKKLEEFYPNLLTFPCLCHSATLAAHAACAEIPEYCKYFLKKIANYINSSPKRTAIYEEFTEICFQETKRKIKKFTNTMAILPFLFLTEMFISDKSKSGDNLLSVMENPDVKAYLLLLKHILNFLNSFNAFFQAFSPKSLELLIQISEHFLKSELVKIVYNDNFTFSKKENQKPLNDINLGSKCEEYFENLMKKGHADIIEKKLVKDCQFKDKFLSKLTVFQFNTALCSVDKKTSFNNFSFIVQTLGGFDENAFKKEWNALHLDFTTMWKEILKRTYPNIKSLLNAIRSLPNSNADPERTFSLLTDLKTKKRNKLLSACINASCVLKSALKTRKKTILDMEINENHLSCMSLDKLYANCLKKKSSLTLYAADNDITSTSATSMQ